MNLKAHDKQILNHLATNPASTVYDAAKEAYPHQGRRSRSRHNIICWGHSRLTKLEDAGFVCRDTSQQQHLWSSVGQLSANDHLVLAAVRNNPGMSAREVATSCDLPTSQAARSNLYRLCEKGLITKVKGDNSAENPMRFYPQGFKGIETDPLASTTTTESTNMSNTEAPEVVKLAEAAQTAAETQEQETETRPDNTELFKAICLMKGVKAQDLLDEAAEKFVQEKLDQFTNLDLFPMFCRYLNVKQEDFFMNVIDEIVEDAKTKLA